MRHGAVGPTTEIGSDPVAVRDYAQAAEEVGYVRLTVYDHVLQRFMGEMRSHRGAGS